MRYGTIVVCGGGCYGGYYVRQLARARAAGAITFARIVVVDRDADCSVARLADAIARSDEAGITAHAWRLQRADHAANDSTPVRVYHDVPIDVVVMDWDAFFIGWFARATAAPDAAMHDAVVPSPLMPHLLADWVASRIVVRHPEMRVTRVPLTVTPVTPWQRTGPDQAHYASFATWMCPINCIEPARCPETRGPRDWTMPAAVRVAADAAAAGGAPYDIVTLFHTTHRTYGVGMFDAMDAVRADQAIAQAVTETALRVLVASVSHCHGALAELHAAPSAAALAP